MLEGEPSEEILTLPSLGAGQPVEVSQVVTIFLMSFTSSFRKWFYRKSQRQRCKRQNPGHSDPMGHGSGSSLGPRQLLRWLPRHPGFYPTYLRMVSAGPGKPSPLVLYLPEFLSALPLVSQLVKGPMPSRATLSRWNRSPEVGRCGGPADTC